MTYDDFEDNFEDEFEDGFERDSYGDLVLRPIRTWQTAPLYDFGAILILEYIHETDEGSMQFILNPQQCLDLADALVERAKLIPNRNLPVGNRPN